MAPIGFSPKAQSDGYEVGINKVKTERRCAVFLDRDGVINRAIEHEGRPYPPKDLTEVEILPEVLAACGRLKAAGFALIVATNQPDVGRGTISQSSVEEIHSYLLSCLPIDRIEVCYHPGRGASNCYCRKPKPGMLLKVASEFGIDLYSSWMVADRSTDIGCGNAAGCRTIFIDRRYDEELTELPDFTVLDLGDAAEIILKQTTKI